MTLTITIKNLQKKLYPDPKKVKLAVLKALSPKFLKKTAELTICLVNDKLMSALNKKYLKREGATDVLAFDNSSKRGELLADIFVSVDTAVRQAKIFKTTPSYELYLYIIHGVLHLSGYTDATVKGEKLMQYKASRILKTLHITPFPLDFFNLVRENITQF